jgi:hypothetical protein
VGGDKDHDDGTGEPRTVSGPRLILAPEDVSELVLNDTQWIAGCLRSVVRVAEHGQIASAVRHLLPLVWLTRFADEFDAVAHQIVEVLESKKEDASA